MAQLEAHGYTTHILGFYLYISLSIPPLQNPIPKT